jgi:hypothetical protein
MGLNMSKGSTPRPFNVAQEQYEARWDLIFGRDKGDKERDFRFDKEMDDRDDGQLERNKALQGMQNDLDRMIERAENEGPL